MRHYRSQPTTPADKITLTGRKNKLAKLPTARRCHFVAFAQIREDAAGADQLAVASITLADAPDTAPGSTGSVAGRAAPG